jgi:hypothetical protein
MVQFMMRYATPLKPLRLGQFRQVLNGIFVTNLNTEPASTSELLGYLKQRPREKAAGIVHTHSCQTSETRKALAQVNNRVFDTLVSADLIGTNGSDALSKASTMLSMRGAQPHTDARVSHDKTRLFWALCLETSDTEVLFGNLGIRVPIEEGTLLVFDPCQPHAVFGKGRDTFMKSHFGPDDRQFFAAGDFPSSSWKDLGVSLSLTAEDIETSADVLTTLVHQKTCLVKVP